MKRVYMAYDETIFENETECIEYELKREIRKNFKKVVDELENFCDIFDECEKCPLYKGENHPCIKLEIKDIYWNG